MADKVKPITINNWAIIVGQTSPYMAPELISSHLLGVPVDHPRANLNGLEVRSSKIIGKRDGMVVTFSGSIYELGTTNPAYAMEFPNAKERVLASLTEMPLEGGAV